MGGLVLRVFGCGVAQSLAQASFRVICVFRRALAFARKTAWGVHLVCKSKWCVGSGFPSQVSLLQGEIDKIENFQAKLVGVLAGGEIEMSAWVLFLRLRVAAIPRLDQHKNTWSYVRPRPTCKQAFPFSPQSQFRKLASNV